jgi:hypothetical protein
MHKSKILLGNPLSCNIPKPFRMIRITKNISYWTNASVNIIGQSKSFNKTWQFEFIDIPFSMEHAYLGHKDLGPEQIRIT